MKKEHKEKALGVLAKLNKKYSDGRFGTACFAGVFDTKATVFYRGAPCHASLSSIGKDCVAVVSLVKLSTTKQEHAEIFYDWLFNDSPWADIFVIKDAKEVLELGGVICKTKFPSNLVAGGLFATRGLWEHPATVKFFAELMEEDKTLNKNLVLISSMWCRESMMRSGQSTYVIGITNAGHWPLSGEQSKKYVSNFVKNKPEKLRDNFCDSSVYRSGCEQWVYPIWGPYRLEAKDTSYQSVLEKAFSEQAKTVNDDGFGGKQAYVSFEKREDFITNMAIALKKVEKGLRV